MGNEASKPKPGTPFRVIAAGQARTGTASMTEALSILLDGPVYHGGTQVVKGNPANVTAWIRILSRFPMKTETDREPVRETIRGLLDGYAAMADQPAAIFTPELLELYPDAMVICTVRDPDSWVRSMGHMADHATARFLRLFLLPLPSVRHFPAYIDAIRPCFIHIYGEREPFTTQTYHRHIEWLKNVVPEDKLVFFNVKDGWPPLCAALGVEVPDVPFPKINDSEAVDKLSAELVAKGMKRWGVIFAVAVGVVSVGMYLGGGGWSFWS